ncbi:MAG: hypothetical protein JWO79_21 [Actinomycetia bacterium]|nr:hypothetical protein [Actinomycetes bacterium]
MLCDSAWAPSGPVGGGGLVVGDPDTAGAAADLVAARLEALAVRHVFYPQARYLGRRVDGSRAADGAGTPGQVRAELARAAAGAVLHAACHGVVAPGTGDEPTSYLMLAAGEAAGLRFTAEDLVATIGADSTPALGLAVLAACSSGVPGRGYDEAFSTATAFLAAGTGSVVSALWSIPDSATSVLMFMFHHFLRELPPAQALRAAQLWMLRPDRELPARMPTALRDRLAVTDPRAAGSWAGFVHAGR